MERANSGDYGEIMSKIKQLQKKKHTQQMALSKYSSCKNIVKDRDSLFKKPYFFVLIFFIYQLDWAVETSVNSHFHELQPHTP